MKTGATAIKAERLNVHFVLQSRPSAKGNFRKFLFPVNET